MFEDDNKVNTTASQQRIARLAGLLKNFLITRPASASGIFIVTANLQPSDFGIQRSELVCVTGCSINKVEAFEACVGEAAETISYLTSLEMEPGKIENSTGWAAGVDSNTATRSAVYELIERFTVLDWWERCEEPIEIRPNKSLFNYVQLARKGDKSRVQLFFRLETELPGYVVASVSFDTNGDQSCIGFSCAGNLESASIKAFNEMVQMEFAMELNTLKSEDPTYEYSPNELRQIWRARYLKPSDPRFQSKKSCVCGKSVEFDLQKFISSSCQIRSFCHAKVSIPVANVCIKGLPYNTTYRKLDMDTSTWMGTENVGPY